MTTLVLHAGAEYADEGAVQQELTACREPLAGVGVLLPPGDSPAEWRETAHGLLRSATGGPATDWLQEAQRSGARVVLVSSDALSDALSSPEEAAALVEMAKAAGVDVRVVVVVREQIGYINSLYCKRVLALDTARSFAEFASTSVPAHRFDYVASFGAVADTDGLDLVAVSYPDLSSTGPARAVLLAAGLEESETAFAPHAWSPPPVPGPVLVGATRLLHKRLRRFGAFHEHGKPRLRLLVDRLARRAAGGWDATSFWGWDVPLRRSVVEEYSASNEMFAEYVWGTPWPEPFTGGRSRIADLADLQAVVLQDVLRTVDEMMTDLAKGTLDLGDQKASGGS